MLSFYDDEAIEAICLPVANDPYGIVAPEFYKSFGGCVTEIFKSIQYLQNIAAHHKRIIFAKKVAEID